MSEEKIEQQCLLKVEHYKIKKGDQFSSWNDFHDFLIKYQKQEKQVFTIANSRLIKTDANQDVNENCKYTFVKLTCKYGPMRKKPRGGGQRATKTIKNDCEAFIYIVLTKNKQFLTIKNIYTQHTGHEKSEQFFDYVVENRRITNEEDKKMVTNLLKLNVPKSQIRDQVLDTIGIHMSAKDLQNYAQKLKSAEDDELNTADRLLKDTYGAQVAVIYEKSNTDTSKNIFRGLYFSTKKMRQSFQGWPEIVFMDGTYNLLKRNLITFIFSIQDANKMSHIVGVGLTTDEEGTTIKALLKQFKEQNKESCDKIKCFMTDKDMSERSVIKIIFPEVRLFICEFHVLKIFSRTITTTKMNITAKERDIILDLLEKMTKSKSPQVYDELYNKFCSVAPKNIIDYFNKNWHGIREEWTRYAISDFNFGNYTNNVSESVNASLKREIKKRSTFSDFIHAFFRYYSRRNDTLKHMLSENIYKKPIRGFPVGSIEFLYEKTLTHTAFKIVISQYKRHKSINFFETNIEYSYCLIECEHSVIRSGVDFCQCIDYSSYRLPCRHIFAVRKFFKLPLFDEKLCCDRWTKKYNQICQPVLQSPIPVNIDKIQSTSNLVMDCLPSPKPVTYSNRLKIMRRIANNIVSSGSKCTGEKFEERVKILEKLEHAWINNLNCTIFVSKNEAESSEDNNNEFPNIQQELNNSVNNLSNDLHNIQITPSMKVSGRPKNIYKSTVKITKKSKEK